MKKINTLVVMLFLMSGLMAPLALADENASADVGVAGCSSVKVDPDHSLEAQQEICHAAEGVASTSCAAGGHGTCSSPKLSDTLPQGDHCICIEEEAVTEVVA